MEHIRRCFRLINKKETFLFILALIIRIIAATLFKKYIDLPFNLWGFETEGFNDFEYFYQTWVKNFISLKWYPYSYGNTIDALNWYSYPPFFLYLISFFGLVSSRFSAIPIVILDAGCVVLVYKILNLFIPSKRIYIPSIIFCFSVINIFYIGIYWLNPAPMTFFLLLSIYYLIKKNNHLSIIFYMTSIMMKQTALYYGLIFMSLYLGEKQVKNWWKPIFLIISLFIIFSIPYIILTPINYFRHLLVSPIPTSIIQLTPPKGHEPITFSHFLVYGLNINSNSIQILNMFVNTYFLITFSTSVISSYSIFALKTKKLKEQSIIFLFMINGFLMYMFQPRGLYKYYLTNLMPLQFIAMLLEIDRLNISKLKKYLFIFLYISYTMSIIIVPRLYTPIILFMFLIFIVMLKISRTRTSGISRNRGTGNEMGNHSVRAHHNKEYSD